MDKNQKSDERFDQSMSSSSRRVMWKLSEEEEEEEIYDSVVTYRRSPGQSIHVSSTQPAKKLLFKDAALKSNQPSSDTSMQEAKEPLCPTKQTDRDAESEEDEDELDNRLSVKPSLGLRYRPSYESLKYKRSKDLGSDRIPSTSRCSMSRKVISDLKLETFSLPPQQSCVVRGEAPKFAQGLRVDNDSDSCCSGELEVPKNSAMLDMDSNPPQQQQQGVRSELVSVHISAPTISPLSEAMRRDGASPIKRRSTTGKKGSSPAAAECKKCPSTNSGSTGPHLPNFRQRQQELHRYRVLVEQRRLDLLELKIAREREDALHSTILFHKKMQIKECKIKAYEDNDCSDV